MMTDIDTMDIPEFDSNMFVDGFADETPRHSAEEDVSDLDFSSERYNEDTGEMEQFDGNDTFEVPDWLKVDEDGEYVGEESDVGNNITNFQDMDDDFELTLFTDEYGNVSKATKASLVEAFHEKERVEAQAAIVNDAGKYLVEYENWMQDRADMMTFETDNAIRELQSKIKSGYLSPVEKANAYDQLEAYTRRMDTIQGHVAQEKAKREATMQKMHAARIQNTIRELSSNYRWNNEMLHAVDQYAVANIPGLKPEMISPQLYLLAKKAMEFDKKNSGKPVEKIEQVKKSANTISSSQRKAAAIKESQRDRVRKAASRGDISPSDMFAFLVD